MRIGSIAWSELSSALGCETALGIAARAWKAPSACSEDGGLAGLKGTGWDEEDELELLESAHGEND